MLNQYYRVPIQPTLGQVKWEQKWRRLLAGLMRCRGWCSQNERVFNRVVVHPSNVQHTRELLASYFDDFGRIHILVEGNVGCTHREMWVPLTEQETDHE